MKQLTTILTTLLLLSFSTEAQNIFRTVCKGDMGRLDSLLQNDSLTVQDNRGRSLLHWAVACKQKEAFDYLIKNGLDINQTDKEGKTPMYVAVQFNNEKYFDYLLDLQPDSTWIATHGTALLEKAILKKSPLFVQKLIGLGVAVNDTNKRGSTPLEIAQRTNEQEIYDWLLASGADRNKVRNITMQGQYMGQTPPDTLPQLFAPNFISTEESEYGAVFNKASTAFYYGVDVNGKSEIRYSERVNNVWTKPKAFLSHERYGYNDPFLSNDENRLYFISKQALDGVGEPKDVDIWYVQKEGAGWSLPINAGTNINSDKNEYYISFTEEGTMYFASNANEPEGQNNNNYDIYYSTLENGAFQKPVALGDSINTSAYEADVFIAPDESYIIFCAEREKEGFGRGDLYISFKNTDNSWTKSINMGAAVNSADYEYCPFVTKDGKYLFYTSKQDIYWVSTAIFDALKTNHQ